MKHIDITNNYILFHPTVTEYKYFSKVAIIFYYTLPLSYFSSLKISKSNAMNINEMCDILAIHVDLYLLHTLSDGSRYRERLPRKGRGWVFLNVLWQLAWVILGLLTVGEEVPLVVEYYLVLCENTSL